MRLSLTVAFALVLSLSAVAHAADAQRYTGTLVEQPEAEFNLVVGQGLSSDRAVLQTAVNDFSLSCVSGQTNTGRGFAVGPETAVGQHGRFRISGRQSEIGERWLIKGRVRGERARGIFRFREDQRDGEPDTCRTGTLHWRASQVGQGPG